MPITIHDKRNALSHICETTLVHPYSQTGGLSHIGQHYCSQFYEGGFVLHSRH